MSVGACERGRAELELNIRYVLNEMGEAMAAALFSPWLDLPVKKFQPVEFGREFTALDSEFPGAAAYTTNSRFWGEWLGH